VAGRKSWQEGSRRWAWYEVSFIERLSGKIGGERSRINAMWMVQFYSISGGERVWDRGCGKTLIPAI
jgi:hypothetical protein